MTFKLYIWERLLIQCQQDRNTNGCSTQAVINLRLMAEATVKIMQNICYWNVASLYILSYSSFFMAMAEDFFMYSIQIN